MERSASSSSVSATPRGRAFYEGLFGWGFETGPSGNGWVITTPNLEGGMHPNDAGGGAVPLLRGRRHGRGDRAACELGGEILDMGRRGDDESVARFGRFKFCKDDQGSSFGLHQPPRVMARVVRHESERDVWEMVHGAPDPRLGGYVLDYCAYDERTGSFVRRRELPSDRVVAIVNFGAPIRVLHVTDGPISRTASWPDCTTRSR